MMEQNFCPGDRVTTQDGQVWEIIEKRQVTDTRRSYARGIREAYFGFLVNHKTEEFPESRKVQRIFQPILRLSPEKNNPRTWLNKASSVVISGSPSFF